MLWRHILSDVPCIISTTVRLKSSCTTRRQIRPPHSNNGLLSSVYTFSDNCFWRKRQIQSAVPWVTLRKHHSQKTWSCGHGLSLMIPLKQVMPRSTESLQSGICWQMGFTDNSERNYKSAWCFTMLNGLTKSKMGFVESWFGLGLSSRSKSFNHVFNI